jgi:hypothetical protein
MIIVNAVFLNVSTGKQVLSINKTIHLDKTISLFSDFAKHIANEVCGRIIYKMTKNENKSKKTSIYAHPDTLIK